MGGRTSQKGKELIISVIGLGKLGACYAAFVAAHGCTVIGTDADARKVEALNKKRAPVEEPDLQTYITKHKARLSAVADTWEAVRASVATFVIVPTPSSGDGSFSLGPAIVACEQIGKALATKKGYHLVVLVSTVLPEDCRTALIPTIERTSGKRCGPDFGFCYSPSLIAIGDVLKNLEHPDFIFLGASDAKAEQALASIYARLYPRVSPERMSIESAELAKIALNSYVTMKITFANTIGMLCEQIPHADTDHVTTALGKDKRVGSYYLKSGLGFGGPCFPRDNTAFAQMAARRGVHTPLARATDEFNKGMPKRIGRTLEELSRKRGIKRIGFLGLSYKPRTTLIEDSQALLIAEDMLRRGYALTVFEPLSTHEVEGYFGKKILYAKTLKELLLRCDIVFISNRDDAFASIPKLLRGQTREKIVVDPWGMFKPSDFKAPVRYHPIGRTS